MAIFMPTNQKRLTNVSIVRLKKGGKRFEVACYPNKVKSWRDHLETDLDEVLHTQTVFLNVSKGEVAKKDDLEKIFKTTDQSTICKEILKRGELQVTGKERHSNLDALFSDVAKIVSQKCINPSSQRAYSVAIIEKAMRACHVKLVPNRSAKQQATEVIALLQESNQLNLEVTLLRVHLNVMCGERVNVQAVHRVRELVLREAAEVLTDDEGESGDALLMEFLVEPGALNEIENQIRAETRGRYEIDISRSGTTKTSSNGSKKESSAEPVRGGEDGGESEEEEEQGAKAAADDPPSHQEVAKPKSGAAKENSDVKPPTADKGGDEKGCEEKEEATASGKKSDNEEEEVNEKQKKPRRRAKKGGNQNTERGESASGQRTREEEELDEVNEKQRKPRRRAKKGGSQSADRGESAGGEKTREEEEIDEEYSNKRRKDRKKKRGGDSKGGANT